MPTSILLGSNRNITISMKRFTRNEAGAWNNTSLGGVSSGNGVTHASSSQPVRPSRAGLLPKTGAGGEKGKSIFYSYLLVITELEGALILQDLVLYTKTSTAAAYKKGFTRSGAGAHGVALCQQVETGHRRLGWVRTSS